MECWPSRPPVLDASLHAGSFDPSPLHLATWPTTPPPTSTNKQPRSTALSREFFVVGGCQCGAAARGPRMYGASCDSTRHVAVLYAHTRQLYKAINRQYNWIRPCSASTHPTCSSKYCSTVVTIAFPASVVPVCLLSGGWGCPAGVVNFPVQRRQGCFKRSGSVDRPTLFPAPLPQHGVERSCACLYAAFRFGIRSMSAPRLGYICNGVRALRRLLIADTNVVWLWPWWLRLGDEWRSREKVHVFASMRILGLAEGEIPRPSEVAPEEAPDKFSQ